MRHRRPVTIRPTANGNPRMHLAGSRRAPLHLFDLWATPTRASYGEPPTFIPAMGPAAREFYDRWYPGTMARVDELIQTGQYGPQEHPRPGDLYENPITGRRHDMRQWLIVNGFALEDGHAR